MYLCVCLFVSVCVSHNMSTLYCSFYNVPVLFPVTTFHLHLAATADIIDIKWMCGAALCSFSHQRVEKHLVPKTRTINFDIDPFPKYTPCKSYEFFLFLLLYCENLGLINQGVFLIMDQHHYHLSKR